MKSAASNGGRVALLVASLMIGVTTGVCAADESAAEAKPAEAAPAPEKPKIDVRKLFATNCSWCPFLPPTAAAAAVLCCPQLQLPALLPVHASG